VLRRALAKMWSIAFRLIYRMAFRSLGRGSFLHRPFRIDGGEYMDVGRRSAMQSGGWLYCCGINGRPANLKIGDGCVFGYNNHITAVGSVVIGDEVLTANNVYISDNIHGYEDVACPIMYQPVLFKRAVVIGDGSWIGENACIIGASVGRNSVIGANAVVTRDIPDYSVAVGSPAVVIRRFDPELKEWIAVTDARQKVAD